MSFQIVVGDARPAPRSAPQVGRPSLRHGRGRARVLDVNAVRTIAERALAEAKDGRASASWRRELQALDRSGRFSKEALRLFQDLQARLGVPTARAILLPLNGQPFWHRTPNPFANYQSTP